MIRTKKTQLTKHKPTTSPRVKRSLRTDVWLNVLGYREGSDWVALALEMDLRGYGKTFKAARRELVSLVNMQISFANFKGQPEMILKPADPVWFERFAETRSRLLNSLLAKQGPSEYATSGIPIPPAHVIANLPNRFTEVNG